MPRPRKARVVETPPVPVPTAAPAVQPAPKKELILEGDPEQQLAFAQKAATALMNWVEQKPKKVLIRGEQYLEFGDWQIIGRFYGSTVGIEWTRPLLNVDGQAIRGYEARANVLRNGEIISSAEAMCLRAERNWRDRDEFMLKSMAQTRASAKALRQAFGWVAELAGMKSTPAEEMGEVYDRSVVEDDAPVVSIGADDDIQTPKPAISKIVAQRQAIFALLKERGVDVSDGEACRRYVADETQLELVEPNFEEIIKMLQN